MIGSAARTRVLGVSELAARLQARLEDEFAQVWVAGEITSLRRAASGHVYFALKDERCQLAAVLFRREAAALPFVPRDGLAVVVLARLGLYAERGALQLYVDAIEPLGLGALRLAFEQLKQRLEAEGLFAGARKRPLPACPRVVGVVTALRGAAIHDVRTVLAARWPQARVLVRPVRVQGAEAAGDVAAGIAELGGQPDVEVLIVGRGGGSLEDLWAFNTEEVARAIAAAPVPVISAVGHEIDFTIADFVADVRAPTPSAAAALAVPDRRELERRLGEAAAALRRCLGRRLDETRRHVARLARGLGQPRRRLAERAVHVDALAGRARRALATRLAWQRRTLDGLQQRLLGAHPAVRGARSRERLAGLRQRLVRGMEQRLAAARGTVAGAAGKLDVLSPLASLARGYAIVRRPDGRVVRDAAMLLPEDTVLLVLAHGRARARILAEEEEP